MDRGSRYANCSGRLFDNLYLFWSENLADADRVKLLTTAPDATLLVEDRFPEWRGWFFTAIGVLCFSLTFPMTRLSLRAFDPILIALVRGAGAGIAAFVYLVLSRSRIPNRRILLRLGSAAIGMVVLFPILVSMALKSVPATHASVLGSILPLATAVFGVFRGRESVSRRFWFFAILGTGLIALFSGYRSGFHSIEQADLLLIAAFIACAYGYAEGGVLAREIGGWLVICWALVTVLPFELVALLLYLSGAGVRIDSVPAEAWVGLVYVTAVSQFIGFFFYYKGLALGGIAKMSQLQLLLPFVAIIAAHWILGEEVEGSVIIGTLVITGIVAAGRGKKRVGERGKRVGVSA
jgi:drug/metabolite transporter (DMT)-like permease